MDILFRTVVFNNVGTVENVQWMNGGNGAFLVKDVPNTLSVKSITAMYPMLDEVDEYRSEHVTGHIVIDVGVDHTFDYSDVVNRMLDTV
jgi:hypothetical protein